MSAATCSEPIAYDALIGYWLGEVDEATQARLEEHLLGCDACSARLAELVALADGMRAAFRHGAVRAFVTEAFVKGLAAGGVRVREYRVPRNGSVNCTVAAEDELLVAHLEAPLAGVTRLDAVSSVAGAPDEVVRDIPFDPASGEVVTMPQLAGLRAMPSHRRRVRLIAIDERGERMIGEYTFNHTAPA